MSSTVAKVNIRRMSASDLERVMEIAATLEHAPHWPLSSYAAAIDSEHTPPRIALVAESETAGDPAGFLLGFVIARLIPPEAELETIAVAEEGQRGGIGAALLSALTLKLRAVQMAGILLEVRASNHAALGFYAAQGFEQIGRRLRYYADPEEDAVLLRLNLS